MSCNEFAVNMHACFDAMDSSLLAKSVCVQIFFSKRRIKYFIFVVAQNLDRLDQSWRAYIVYRQSVGHWQMEATNDLSWILQTPPMSSSVHMPLCFGIPI
jgi:hypothetical protein